MGAVRVQCRRLGIARVIDRRAHRIETVDRLVAALAGDVLVAARVAHQARLRRVIERRVEA